MFFKNRLRSAMT